MNTRSRCLTRLFQWGVLVVFLTISIGFIYVSPAKALSGVKILEQTEKMDYPVRIAFSLKGETTKTISNSIVEYTAGPYKLQTLSSSKTYTGSFTIETEIPMGGFRHMPAGITLKYVWKFTFSDGSIERSDEKSLFLIDNRFQWQEIKMDGLPVTIHWYTRPQSFILAVRDKIDAALKRIQEMMGPTMTIKVTTHIWIFANIRDYQKTQGLSTEDWSGGVAYTEYNTSYFPIDTLDNRHEIEGTLPHELTHLVLGQHHEPGDIPSWWHEGNAVYNQWYQKPNYDYHYQKAVDSNTLIPISKITDDWPDSDASASEVNLAYAQSYYFVKHLYTKFGKPKMNEFLTKLDAPQTDFHKTFKQHFGVSVPQAESDWHVSLNLPATYAGDPVETPEPTPGETTTKGRDYTELYILGGSALAVLGAVVLIVVIVVRGARRRRRERVLAQVDTFLAQQRQGYQVPPNGQQYNQPGFYGQPPQGPITPWPAGPGQQPQQGNPIQLQPGVPVQITPLNQPQPPQQPQGPLPAWPAKPQQGAQQPPQQPHPGPQQGGQQPPQQPHPGSAQPGQWPAGPQHPQQPPLNPPGHP